MGTDIHLFAEKKNSDLDWEHVPVEVPYDGRNYKLFSILAGVRNWGGFAGCDTGDPLNPIASPRGLPEDVSSSVRQESDSWGNNAHSHSWLTLKEMLDYNWEQLAVLRGIVNQAGFAEFLNNGKPDSYCGGVSGLSVKMLSNAEMHYRVRNSIAANENYYTKIEWICTYRDCAAYFFDTVIPWLQNYANGDPSGIRLVFWFDS